MDEVDWLFTFDDTAHHPNVCVFCYQVSDGSLESLEAEDNPGPECFLVRRLSSRTLQLPPLAFRQAEQFDWKENDQIPRPTTLAPNMPPLIAITLAESNRDYDLTGNPTVHCGLLLLHIT
ncbi:hypothetical protein HF521_002226 [Silurus meridionalis]|uniref:Uncharacterized protein n=1 Tax=Silurus meridionalis TaxID=175797 RepID=A0A8T0B3V6_SILME|nr:hypothetical protein HF521_002226 [Silurus meridionalis]